MLAGDFDLPSRDVYPHRTLQITVICKSTGHAGCRPPTDDTITMTADSPPLREVSENPHLQIPLPDGCTLSARVWIPADADLQPVPAILEHLPYRKRDGTVHRDELTHPWMAARGYACIRTDMRGSGESDGLMTDEYTEQELQDACDVIAWLCDQPWCDGNIGMMGISWGGFNSLQVAALKPAGLKAIITLCSTVDRFADDIHYKGGCLLNENIGWASNMLSYASPPPDPMLVGADWQTLWMNRLNNQPFLGSIWLREQSRSDYWKHGSVCEDYNAIEAAVLSIGGWHDGYRNTIAHLVENLSAPVKGIVGPWIHKYPHYAKPQPAIGFLQEAQRWWDQWLKGIDTGVNQDPDYRVWLMNSVKPERWLDERPGQWIDEPALPSPNIVTTQWHLSNAHGNSKTQGNTMDKAISSGLSVSVASPQTCGQNTGEYFPFTFGPELPDEQSADDKQSVCFDTSLLTGEITIVGAPTLAIKFDSTQPKAFIAVRLCDVRPDGTSALITMGVLNLLHRDSAEVPATLVPGETYNATVTLDQIAYKIGQGHKLRIALSTTYWPFIWPSPVAATLHLTEATLNLPERTQPDADNTRFEEPVTAPGWQTETLRESSSTRSTSVDDKTGTLITVIDNDFGEVKDCNHDLRNGSRVTERWSIHPDDPLSAKAELHWQQTGGRDDWHWRTDAHTTMHSDTDNFYVKARLTVVNNDEVILEREFQDTIPRVFV